jgi:tetratricopeptide (TPR) repeat protein
MTEPQPKSSVPKVGLIVLAIVAIVVGALFLLPPSEEHEIPGPGPTELPLARIAELKNLGIAHLENHDLDEAAACFEELITLLPEERFCRQNLAIVRLLKIAPENLNRVEHQSLFDTGLAAAKQAVDELRQRFPDEAQSHVLAARLELSAGNEGKAIQALQRAAELAPDDAAIRVAIYDAGRYSRNDELLDVANKALGVAWELSQDNLYVMREWLTVQARGKDPKVGETLKTARKLVAPFVDRIQTFHRQNLNELIDQGIAALPKEDWSLVIRSAMLSANLLRPEVATQNDAKKVTPHLLEFIVHDFSEDFYANNTLPQPEFAEAIPISFAPIETPFQKLKDVRQVQVADFDLNRTQDVVTVQADRIGVWTLNENKYRSWTETTSLELSSADLPSNLIGVCLFDVDRDADVVEREVGDEKLIYADADLDVIAFGKDGLVVLRNDLIEEGDQAGHRILVPVEQNEAFSAIRNVLTALPVDFDHDGDLDLVVSAEAGISIWLNRDDSTFVDHSKYSTLPPTDPGFYPLIAVDWDRNMSIDILAFGAKQSGVLKNVLHGQLRWEPFPEDSGISGMINSAALLDADANFSWDIAGIEWRHESDDPTHPDSFRARIFTTANPDAGTVRFIDSHPISASTASNLVSADFDNDGFTDIITIEPLSSESTDTSCKWILHRGGPASQFRSVADVGPALPSELEGFPTVGDVDSDGDIDLLFVCENSVELFINEGGNANNWIDIPIRAENAKEAQKPNERVNIHGVGSLLEVRSGAAYQPQVVTGQSTHFGLGKQKQVDSARVLWTNGVPEHIVNAQHGVPVCLQQQLKGSCPYLYTWDGEKFAFYTDCLWAAPIGLQFAEGVLATPREWEYLKIDGDRLKAKDGEYILRLTEELWEIGYFDSVRLLAIDHPADVEIYSNEKVGPASISPFKVHTVRNARPPVAAVDQKGRDVLPKIATRDVDYLQCFDRRFKQGLTEPHFLELDLGELDDPQEITLFLTGWIRPTDTSLNIAISQRPDLESTQPPSVHVPGANGDWIKVQPYMGFPGGKTKTIAIDLSDVFPTDDHRVRIATTMEIYWDHAFFTVDETPVKTNTTEMPLVAADLRYRGFSTKLPHAGLGPETYDYGQLDLRLHWPPLEGRLTTYGDVTELVQRTDNRQALLGAGDEMEVRFKVISTELPAGWKRDFILHNVGWDKDADLNTVYGQTVDPLPFGGMVGYPATYGPGEQKPFAAQTRQQSRAKFWRALSDTNQPRPAR